MRRTQWSWFLVRLALLGLPLLLAAPVARAASVAVVPADTTVFIGDTFKLRVEAGSFADLKAYELIFSYDNTVLQYLGPIAGDVLTGTPGAYTVQSLPPVSPPPFTAGVDCAKLNGATSGPGVLIYYQFKAIAVGTSPIGCVNVDFRDSLNNQTIPACFPGAVHVTFPVPTAHSTWGRIKTIYR
jgi:hypothetical protein